MQQDDSLTEILEALEVMYSAEERQDEILLAFFKTIKEALDHVSAELSEVS